MKNIPRNYPLVVGSFLNHQSCESQLKIQLVIAAAGHDFLQLSNGSKLQIRNQPRSLISLLQTKISTIAFKEQ